MKQHLLWITILKYNVTVTQGPWRGTKSSEWRMAHSWRKTMVMHSSPNDSHREPDVYKPAVLWFIDQKTVHGTTPSSGKWRRNLENQRAWKKAQNCVNKIFSNIWLITKMCIHGLNNKASRSCYDARKTKLRLQPLLTPNIIGFRLWVELGISSKMKIIQ